jgi:polar amino acid transport system permease protein
MLMTIWLSGISILLSIGIGIAGAWLQGSKFQMTRRVVQGYIQFFRNTPPLIQMFFFYFGIGSIMPRLPDGFGGYVPIMNNFGWAVLSLSFFGGAFNVEIFRSGIEAVPMATVEAAESLGYTRLKSYIHIILPLAFRICLPALNNNLINLLKTSTYAYAIAVPEALYVASQIYGDQENVFEMMNILLIFYLILVGILVWVSNRWEKMLKIPGYSI